MTGFFQTIDSQTGPIRNPSRVPVRVFTNYLFISLSRVPINTTGGT